MNRKNQIINYHEKRNTYQKQWDTAKPVSRGKFIVLKKCSFLKYNAKKNKELSIHFKPKEASEK